MKWMPTNLPHGHPDNPNLTAEELLLAYGSAEARAAFVAGHDAGFREGLENYAAEVRCNDPDLASDLEAYAREVRAPVGCFSGAGASSVTDPHEGEPGGDHED